MKLAITGNAHILPRDKCKIISETVGAYINGGVVMDKLFYLPDTVFGRTCRIEHIAGGVHVYDPTRDDGLTWEIPPYFIEYIT